ncbi:hypothetical protein VNO78_21390 [Psophocarpus tetragonolobus]|uniref:Uncharacterized protein n=1 Tax=Psophocarpus tetragonolobus TaxID=3891 RepID=A0AAN9SC23_PSOTE
MWIVPKMFIVRPEVRPNRAEGSRWEPTMCLGRMWDNKSRSTRGMGRRGLWWWPKLKLLKCLRRDYGWQRAPSDVPKHMHTPDNQIDSTRLDYKPMIRTSFESSKERRQKNKERLRETGLCCECNSEMVGVRKNIDAEAGQTSEYPRFYIYQMFPNDIPTISKVIEILEGNMNSLEFPPKPVLSFPARSMSEFISSSFQSG